MLYDAPDFRAAFRGKIARGEAFAVYGRVDGDEECRVGWARVGVTAFACLHRSELTEDGQPRSLPRIGANGLTPFIYLRRRNAETPAPLWRSRSALRRDAEPIGELEMDHDYAFVARRFAKRQRVLQDATRRTVKEADVRRLRPSAFEGRDLAQEPLPSEGIVGWAVGWPSAAIFSEPDPDTKAIAAAGFQTTVHVLPEPSRKRGRNLYALADGSGFIEAKMIRRYLPAPAPAEVVEDQRWIDVELTQQTLAIMRGQQAEFITLISSGTSRHPTPPGLYRIENKQAFGDMRSRPSDDDPYYVESVPWVMYFDGRFALHGAFWHNRFGNRVSHGCINLAPKDAARVFGELAPVLPDGWHSVYEHQDDLGTLVRIRKADAEPVDRRRPPRRRTASD